MLFATLSRLHSLALLLVLTFLGATIIGAAKTGFVPDHSRYDAAEFQNKQGGSRFIVSVFPNPQGKRVLLLDNAATDPVIASTVPREIVDRLSKSLARKGITATHSYGIPLDKIVGQFDAAVLLYPCENYVNADFDKLAAKLDAKVLFDYCAGWSSTNADAAGLMHMNFARTYWPHWLDPEMRQFVEYMQKTTADGDGVLLVPSEALSTTAARARWFLPLNYYLAPRRFYLYKPEEGTSFLTEYFQWVKDYSETRPHKNQQRMKSHPRALSKLANMNTARTLNDEELEIAESRDVQWILFWRHQADFKICDFELVDIDTVRGWK
ncbi:MAG TPA: hypothetical protein EYN86_01690 [Planctomycetes bacterium]|nr:hypothetical protein [Planctomycetota bacterium]